MDRIVGFVLALIILFFLGLIFFILAWKGVAAFVLALI